LRSKFLLGFTLYGFIVGLISMWWWHVSDNLFLLNIPGMILGDKIYEVSILFFGDPYSPQAHFSIPWILRIPQVYVPVSVFFWAMVGLLIQTKCNRFYSDGRGSK